MHYQTILFDADETLFDFRQAERTALEKTCISYGIPFDQALLARYHEINEALWRLLEQGRTTQAQLRLERFVQLFASLGISMDGDAFNRDYTTALGQCADLLPGALELCQTLAAHCPLYIVTNGLMDVQTSRLAASPLAPYIKRMFVSEAIGFSKPDPRFFNAVFHYLCGASRQDTILLGDSLSSDIKGGRAAGIATCWYASDDAPGSGDYDYRISRLADFVPIVLL